MTEHFAGAFPTWLAPVQAKIIPVSEHYHDYAKTIYEKLFNENIRCELDNRNEKLGYKIRDGQMQKIPYLLIVGAKEEENNSIAVRHRKLGELGSMTGEEFISRISIEIRDRVLTNE